MKFSIRSLAAAHLLVIAGALALSPSVSGSGVASHQSERSRADKVANFDAYVTDAVASWEPRDSRWLSC